MKKRSLSALTAILSLVAVTAHARPSAKTAPAKLSEDINQFAEVFAQFDCVFSAQSIDGGYLLRIVDEKKNVLEVSLTGLQSLKLRGHEEGDGSYDHVFSAADGASVQFTHFDDAYDHVTISNGQQTLKCEADY